MAATFKNKQLQLKQASIHLEQLKDCKMNKNEESGNLLKNMSFHQKYKRQRELLKMSRFRTLTYVEDREKHYRRKEKEEMDRHCMDNYGPIVNSDKTMKSNSMKIIGNKNNALTNVIPWNFMT